MSNKTKIGVIGGGFVGKAIAKGFMLHANISIYDIDPEKSTDTFDNVILNSDFVFIALPTPMIDIEGGKADLSIMHDFFQKASNTRKEAIKNSMYFNTKTIFIIKSTIPVGTTRKLCELYGLTIIHSPEFLTERTANIDFLLPARNIIGGLNQSDNSKVAKLFQDRFPETPCYIMPPEEAELVKYMCNCFFATKVMFFNEMRLLVDRLGMDWDSVMNGVLSDGRIAHSHTDIPGHDGDRGIGGKCFPKDINALISILNENNIDPKVLEAVWEQNKAIRKNWDWANIKGATLQNNY